MKWKCINQKRKFEVEVKEKKVVEKEEEDGEEGKEKWHL